MSATLYVAISSHGYGHLGMTAPVVNEVVRRHPDMKVVVECAMPQELLARRLAMPFEHVPLAMDFGMVMRDALSVNVEQSHARYVEQHKALSASTREAAERLRRHKASVVLTNVGYVPILAARAVGIPALSLCCLNWADIYDVLCGHLPGADKIHAEMLDAYRQADVFVAPEPAMPMAGLDNRVPVGLIAERRSDIRATLRGTLNLSAADRVVTVSMGGIATALDMDRWPVVPGVTWLVTGRPHRSRNDMVMISDLPFEYLDIVCSSDALITKPGYGAFSEAACNGVPVLYVPRADWPEAPCLVQWLKQHGTCLEIGYGDLFTEALPERLNALWRMERSEPILPTGINEAADIVQRFLASAMGQAPAQGKA